MNGAVFPGNETSRDKLQINFGIFGPDKNLLLAPSALNHANLTN